MNKSWVISVDMGYGHQRAAYPLRDLAYERIITANSDKVVSGKEKREWQRFQLWYEFLSRSKSGFVLGNFIWKIYEKSQEIKPLYPYRDLSKPDISSRYIHRLIRKNFMKSIIEYVKKENLPFVATFFAPAMAAEHAGLTNVYCVVTDTDVCRAWVPENPKQSKIYYLTPTSHATTRLKEYGIPHENIFYTGFPLPEENLGKNLATLKKDLGGRLVNLDPKKIHLSRFKDTIRKQLGSYYGEKSTHPLTLTYAVGGAGAQKDVAYLILRSFKEDILAHKIRINLIAGTRLEVNAYFMEIIHELELTPELGKYLTILSTTDKYIYFKEFNELLHTTDILWTKPSELCFYSALGIPLIMATPLGSHEELNQQWLIRKGAGINAEDPRFASEWLFELLNNGTLAEAAYNGFLKSPKHGTENIRKLIFAKDKKSVPLRY